MTARKLFVGRVIQTNIVPEELEPTIYSYKIRWFKIGTRVQPPKSTPSSTILYRSNRHHLDIHTGLTKGCLAPPNFELPYPVSF